MKYCKAILWSIQLFFILAGSSCRSSTPESLTERKHAVDIKYKDGSRLYVDKVSSSSFLRATTDSSNYAFCCYRIGIADSVLYDQKQEERWGKYFNYDMQHEWMALCNGDSLRAVFFQPSVSRNKQTKEGVIVFEVPDGDNPDSLIYNSTFGSARLKQLIVLNSNK